MSLEQHGDLDLDEYAEAIDYNERYAIQSDGGHEYDAFPWGTSVLVTPIVFVADKAASVVGVDLAEYVNHARETGKEDAF